MRRKGRPYGLFFKKASILFGDPSPEGEEFLKRVRLGGGRGQTRILSARLERAKKRPSKVETILKEAMDISLRSGYRLKLADLHLFCGEVLLEDKKKDAEKLLGFTAHEHLQKAKEYALDVSEFKHLYQSEDPHFYDGIPEYEMLKRGMTKEERIRNGYFVVYKIAETLEKRGKR